MKKFNVYVTSFFMAVTSVGAFAQQITGASSHSPVDGGARILEAQGNTAANPAIGFHSTASSVGTANNDGGGGNGIFRPAPNVMAFSTGSTERMRISSGGAVGIGVLAPTAKLHTFGTVRLESLASSTTNTMLISTDANGNLSYQPASSFFPSSISWLLGGNSGTNPLTDFLGTNDANPLNFRTSGTQRAIFTTGGEMGIGTTTPMAQLDVDGAANLTNTAIIGKGIRTGVFGEASEMAVGQTAGGIGFGTNESIGVFGKGLYTSHIGNSISYGVVGSSTAINPQNNVGVFGEAQNATGYNWGVRGSANSSTGLYNTGVSGEVKLNSTAQWNRAIAGYAPVAPNHYAGYFDGKVAIVDGTQQNNYILTSDATGLASWTDPATITSGSDWHLAGNIASPTDFIGTTNSEALKIHTQGSEKVRILTTGEMGIGTTTPMAQLDVKSVPSGVQTAIKGLGINTGVYGEATDMNAPLTAEGTLAGWTEAIGVFGKGNYVSNVANGNIFGVVGSATAATNPLNNVGVYGEAKNASGYNTGVYGAVTYGGVAPVKGIYNSGVAGKVDLNTTAQWNRAINGYAPVAPNHYAGYFDGKVSVMSGNVGINSLANRHKLNVHDGALMLSGNVAGFGGPQLLFSDDTTTHPNGKWAIEYIKPIAGSGSGTRPSMGGLNFWKPFNAGYSGVMNYSLFLKDDGKVGMGVTDDFGDGNFNANALPNGYRLYVNGGILTTKVRVAIYGSTAWADYVFSNDYKLKSLAEVETFIKANKHLPNIPSASELAKDGLDLAEMQAKQMEKIEELTLYMIEMKKEIDSLKKQNEILKIQTSKKY
jgi:hypothetical protein